MHKFGREIHADERDFLAAAKRKPWEIWRVKINGLFLKKRPKMKAKFLLAIGEMPLHFLGKIPTIRPRHNGALSEQVVTKGGHVKLLILQKIERHAPKLSGLVGAYRSRGEEPVRAAIVNTVLASDVRYLSRDEVLYLAWLKADYDQRVRAEEEASRRRWQEKQRREQRHLRATSRQMVH